MTEGESGRVMEWIKERGDGFSSGGREYERGNDEW